MKTAFHVNLQNVAFIWQIQTFSDFERFIAVSQTIMKRHFRQYLLSLQ